VQSQTTLQQLACGLETSLIASLVSFNTVSHKKTIRKGVMTTFVSTNPYDQISLFELAANLIGSPTGALHQHNIGVMS
jgi:hypothetical protein